MSAKAKYGPPAVVFVLISWARRYDGTESLTGGHKYLKDNPEENAEAEAFVRQGDGYFYCGAGRGATHEDSLDVVFIARDQVSAKYRVVAVYKRAKTTLTHNWATVQAKQATTFPVGRRPVCGDWPMGQGMRRWARRRDSNGLVHESLLKIYTAALRAKGQDQRDQIDADPELSLFEGQQRRLFVLHRRREARLRAAKIRQALVDGKGSLTCQVPNCGFDFSQTYGEIGDRYAVVHHTRPLASSSAKGTRTLLNDLAIVCANCHAMIHRGGQCRPMDTLIGKRRSR